MAAAREAPLRILCLSGPNLQLLGTREPTIYGHTTLKEIHSRLQVDGKSLGVRVDCKQSNHEGDLCDWIGSAPRQYAGLLLNAAGLTHTSITLLDALRAANLPCIEVHISNPSAREPFRRRSYVARACLGVVAGFGPESYQMALEGLVRHLRTA
jgi:3-dehydroquinate dehydratase II